MSRRVFTAADVRRLADQGQHALRMGTTDLITPLARDEAHERGVTLEVHAAPDADPPSARSSGNSASRQTRLAHVASVDRVELEPFPAELNRPEMDVRLRDVISGDGLPMAAGVMSLRAGRFPWALDYDEIEYVMEGELHIDTSDQHIVGRPGDIIAVPKGSNIHFGTPSWARFLYVTYPADWTGGS